jgi:hypothetical protein
MIFNIIINYKNNKYLNSFVIYITYKMHILFVKFTKRVIFLDVPVYDLLNY